ncbi:hypothetical protein AB1E18_010435 [Capra hircus]
MAPCRGKEKQAISLGPRVAEEENVFGVCHTSASFIDAFAHGTDLSGKETICHLLATSHSAEASSSEPLPTSGPESPVPSARRASGRRRKTSRRPPQLRAPSNGFRPARPRPRPRDTYAPPTGVHVTRDPTRPPPPPAAWIAAGAAIVPPREDSGRPALARRRRLAAATGDTPSRRPPPSGGGGVRL